MNGIYDEARLALHAIWTRRWLALAVAWGVCVLGWLIVALIPNTYESEARVFIQLDDMLAALDKYMPKAPGLSWIRAEGGIYVWLTLPAHVDTSREAAMFQESVKHGVIYVPGAYAYSPDEQGNVPKNSLRLCFGIVPTEQIEPGIERLAGVVKQMIGSREGVALAR